MEARPNTPVYSHRIVTEDTKVYSAFLSFEACPRYPWHCHGGVWAQLTLQFMSFMWLDLLQFLSIPRGSI